MTDFSIALHEVNAVGQVGPETPTVVLGHALGVDSQIWEGVTRRLRGDWRIILWDQPGHGNTPVPTFSPNIAMVAGKLVQALEDVGVNKFHLGGISLGGMVSLALTAEFPQRVRSLALLDCGPTLLPPEPWWERAQAVEQDGMGPLVDPTMKRWFTEGFTLGPARDEYLRVRQIFARCDPAGYAFCCRMIAATDLRGSLPEVRTPTLVLTGAEDAGMTPAQAQKLASEIPGATDEFQVVAPARHLTCVEQAAAVAQSLESLWERH